MSEKAPRYLEREPIIHRTALVVGSASGIGRAITETLAHDPYFSAVIAADINPSIYGIYHEEVYPTMTPLELDIRDPDQISDVVKEALIPTGGIDVLINSAGVINRGRWETYFRDGVPTPDFDVQWETNLMGPLTLMHTVLPHMREQGGGTVINISSLKYAAPDPFSEVYGHVKQLFARATHENRKRELAHNIRIVDVQPGAHQTEIDRGIWTKGNDMHERRAAQFLYCYFRDTTGSAPDNVARTVHKIASGDIDRERVLIGWDANLCVTLYDHFPYWEELFQRGYGLTLRAVDKGFELIGDNAYSAISVRHPDWHLPRVDEF